MSNDECLRNDYARMTCSRIKLPVGQSVFLTTFEFLTHSTLARMSVSRRILTSLPSTSMSVPEYLP